MLFYLVARGKRNEGSQTLGVWKFFGRINIEEGFKWATMSEILIDFLA